MLLPRLLTALLGLPLLLAAVYFGSLPFFFLVLGVVLLGLREFYYLARQSGYPSYPWLGLLAGGLVASSVFLNGVALGSWMENQATAALTALLIVVLAVRGLWGGNSETVLSEWSVTLFGVFCVGWSLSHLLLLRDLRPEGQALTFFLFVLIWAEDVAAYLVGTRWGRRPIAGGISPQKTWEGTLGGIAAALGVAGLFQATLLRQQLKMPEALVLGGLTGALAFVSDLSESMMKRGAGVKDSSPLLPGHGGILDRFDSLFLTAPFFYYYWAFMKH